MPRATYPRGGGQVAVCRPLHAADEELLAPCFSWTRFVERHGVSPHGRDLHPGSMRICLHSEKGFLDNRMEPWVEGVVYIRALPLTFRLRGVACRNDVDPGKSRIITERVL